MIWVLVVIVVIVLGIIALYNSLIRLRVQCENAWADIDVQLRRRYNLIPNLVETVKGYASHEQKTFQQVTEARTRAMSAQGPAEKAAAEGFLTQALKSLFAVAEAYPQLRAVENFTQLQSSLSEIEEAIQNARRYYNAVVRDFNTKIAQFPANIIAGMFGFVRKDFFEVEEAEVRAVPRVDFSTGQGQGEGSGDAGEGE